MMNTSTCTDKGGVSWPGDRYANLKSIELNYELYPVYTQFKYHDGQEFKLEYMQLKINY